MTKQFDERNMAKSRRVCEDMEAAHVTKWLKLTERERQILAMWPRFEDGELVMPGDKVHYASAYNDETSIEVESITAMDGYFVLCDDECRSNQYEQGQRVKRPVQSVLDADGVEIKLGDTVWALVAIDGELVVEDVDNEDGFVGTRSENGEYSGVFHTYLTHTRPDSWELLEEDAAELDDMPCDFNAKDLIRRANALAGVEVD